MKVRDWQLPNANIVFPDSVKGPAGIIIASGKISKITEPGEGNPELLNLNLNGLNVYPSLINSFDTLLDTYDFVRGGNWPYTNWLAYDNEVKLSQTFQEKMMFDARTLYLLGSYKNLLGGSVFVVDHIPHFVRLPFQDNLPVSLLKDFGISHSVCSYSPEWGEGIEKEYEKAERLNIPFIVRIGEGFDPESVSSLQRLKKEGGLGPNTVLVNCLSLSDQDILDIRRAESSVTWCPTSTRMLYEESPPIQKLLDAGVNICIGSDNSMRGSSGMLNELHSAVSMFQDEPASQLNHAEVFRMATQNAVKALKIKDRGEIQKNSFADFLVLSERSKNPYSSITAARASDIFLLVHNGVPLLGDISLERIFQEMKIPYEKIIVDETTKLIVEGIGDMLDQINRTLKFKKDCAFLPVKIPEQDEF